MSLGLFVGGWSFEMQIRLQMSLSRYLFWDAVAHTERTCSRSDDEQQYRIPITKYGKLTLLSVEEKKYVPVLFGGLYIQAIRIIQKVMGSQGMQG